MEGTQPLFLHLPEHLLPSLYTTPSSQDRRLEDGSLINLTSP